LKRSGACWAVLSEIRCTPRLLIPVIPAITWQVSNRWEFGPIAAWESGLPAVCSAIRAFGTAFEVNAISFARDQAAMLVHAKDGS
jgi:hypothetical protein